MRHLATMQARRTRFRSQLRQHKIKILLTWNSCPLSEPQKDKKDHKWRHLPRIPSPLRYCYRTQTMIYRPKPPAKLESKDDTSISELVYARIFATITEHTVIQNYANAYIYQLWSLSRSTCRSNWHLTPIGKGKKPRWRTVVECPRHLEENPHSTKKSDNRIEKSDQDDNRRKNRRNRRRKSTSRVNRSRWKILTQDNRNRGHRRHN